MLCLGEAIGHGLYDRILQRTETAQTQRWIAAECGREGLLENSKDGGLKHLTTTAVIVIVVQSLIELFEMMFYLKQVPSKLLPIRSTI